jgi:hypothetical protein
MTAVVGRGTLAWALVFCIGCHAEQPTAPSSVAPNSSMAPAAPRPPAPPSGPPLSGLSTTFRFSAPLDSPVSSYTSTTKYVLYDNGAFSLRYEAPGEGAYTGSYRQEDGRILFDFGADGRGSGSADRTLSQRSTAIC